MLINGVHYGRKKIYRVYKGSELVWYVGDILSLYGDILVRAGSVSDNNMTIAPLVLGNAENAHSFLVDCFNHGIAVPIVPFHHELTQPIYVDNDAVLRVFNARLGNHQKHIVVYVESKLSGRAYDARIGSHFAKHRVRVDKLGTATAADARIGHHVAAHLVEIRRLGTGTAANAVLLAHLDNVLVNATYQGTGIAAPAVQLTHTNNALIEASYQGTGVSAIAVIGHRVSDLLVEASYQQTAVGADAVLFNKISGVQIEASYQGSGVGAAAKLLNHIQGVAVEASYQNSGVPAPVISLDNTIILRVDTDNEAAALAADIALGNGEVTHLVIRENKLNGTPLPLVSFFRDKGVRINDAVDGTINPNGVVLLSGELDAGMAVSKEHHGTVASGVVGSGSCTTNLHTDIEGSLTGELQIVSLAADITLACKTITDAHLTDWRMPIQNGSDLYIHSVYKARQNGNDLVLADNYSEPAVWFSPIQTEDGLYIRQVYEGRQVDTDLILQGVEWLAPIKTEDGLYIRQTSLALSLGTDLSVS